MEYVEIEITILYQTPSAVFVRSTDDGEEYWIPWSQVEDNGENFKNGYEGPMWVTEWFAEKEGIA